MAASPQSPAADGAAGTAPGALSSVAERISFSEVARAHRRWDEAVESSSADGGTERIEFYDALTRFEALVDAREDARVRVVETYWCKKQASGVALVEIDETKMNLLRRLARRVLGRQAIPEFRIYRESDWVTIEYSQLANLLHECDVLAIKTRWGLEGLHEAVVMSWLTAIEEHILGFIERDWLRREAIRKTQAPPDLPAPDPDAFARDVVTELNRVEDYYQQAGAKRARLHFVNAMLTGGVIAVAVAGALLALFLWVFGVFHPHAHGIRLLYFSMAAGATGAVVSVLMRMAGVGGDFHIDHELGSMGVRRLGAFRPLVGAISGLIVGLIYQTTLVTTQRHVTAFFVVIAFLAGFSERWTKVVLGGAMRTVEPTDEKQKTQTKTQPAGQPT